MSVHSRRLSLLSELHLATVNITASLAKRIPAPTHWDRATQGTYRPLPRRCRNSREPDSVAPFASAKKFADGERGRFAYAR